MRPALFTSIVAMTVVASSARCGDEPATPIERIGEPLAVTPSREGGSASNDASALSASEGGGPEADGADAGRARWLDVAPEPHTPQPAKALSLAAEADRQGARGELGEAMATYGRAVKLNPQSPWLRTAWAWYLARTGKTTQARDELEQALDLIERPDPLLTAAVHHGLGELRESRRDWARARESYRTALRAWSAPPLARALLRVLPETSDQRSAAERLAFDGESLPAKALEIFSKRGGAAPLAAAALKTQGLVMVTSLPEPRASPLPAGAQYRVHIESEGGPPDAGSADAPAKLVLGETSSLRWHQATAKAVTIPPDRPAILVTIERTAPGAGAPSEAWTSLVAVGSDDELVHIVTRQTGAERDDPLGCRRGWREGVSVQTKSLQVIREDFVRPRLEQAGPICTKRAQTRAPETVAYNEP